MRNLPQIWLKGTMENGQPGEVVVYSKGLCGTCSRTGRPECKANQGKTMAKPPPCDMCSGVVWPALPAGRRAPWRGIVLDASGQ